jgi:hypothetical protein
MFEGASGFRHQSFSRENLKSPLLAKNARSGAPDRRRPYYNSAILPVGLRKRGASDDAFEADLLCSSVGVVERM